MKFESGIYQGDCVQKLAEMEAGSVHLAFADPPFNIGYKYDVYDDRKGYAQYLDWSRQWMSGVARVLRPDGTFWLAIGDEYAAELKLIAQNDLGLTCRSWVIWYYTFGVNCTKKFNRSHAHLFHFVKDGRLGKFTFNAEDPAVRVPSARQLVYADGRANPDGRLPDDTWILRPQDVPNGFSAEQDTWYYPRVAGTFKERAGFHGCQMPEQLLGRIIRISSNEGDRVLDPFGGSGTTLVVAKKLNRQFVGFELSTDYAKKIKARLDAVSPGQPLDGSAEPQRSAPQTIEGKTRRSGTVKVAASVKSVAAVPKLRVLNGLRTKPRCKLVEFRELIVKAFEKSRRGHSSDYLLAHPDINREFIQTCMESGIPGEPTEWNRFVINLRKSGALPSIASRNGALLTPEDLDRCGFASEIALRELTSDGTSSLDDVLCDPELALRFDSIAASIVPGFSAFQFRWAALSIRKRKKDVIVAANALISDSFDPVCGRLHRFSDVVGKSLGVSNALYVLRSDRGKYIYVGETDDIGYRLRLHEHSHEEFGVSKVQIVPWTGSDLRRRGAQALLAQRWNTPLNFQFLAAS